MAQRTIHYAIAKNIIKQNLITNSYRFIIGNLLPDCSKHSKKSHDNTHYAYYDETKKKKTYDFSQYYKEYKNEIHSDDLFLGYYTHLITDAVYRKFIYYEKGLIKCKKDSDYIQKFHSDYKVLNKIIIKNYKLEKITIDTDLSNNIYIKSLDNLHNDINTDFTNNHTTNQLNYLNYDIIEEFIAQITKILVQEIKSIKDNGFGLLNKEDYMWQTNKN